MGTQVASYRIFTKERREESHLATCHSPSCKRTPRISVRDWPAREVSRSVLPAGPYPVGAGFVEPRNQRPGSPDRRARRCKGCRRVARSLSYLVALDAVCRIRAMEMLVAEAVEPLGYRRTIPPRTRRVPVATSTGFTTQVIFVLQIMHGRIESRAAMRTTEWRPGRRCPKVVALHPCRTTLILVGHSLQTRHYVSGDCSVDRRTTLHDDWSIFFMREPFSH